MKTLLVRLNGAESTKPVVNDDQAFDKLAKLARENWGEGDPPEADEDAISEFFDREGNAYAITDEN